MLHCVHMSVFCSHLASKALLISACMHTLLSQLMDARRAVDAKRKRQEHANRASSGHVLYRRPTTSATPTVTAAERKRKRRTEVDVEQAEPIPSGDGPTVCTKRGRLHKRSAANSGTSQKTMCVVPGPFFPSHNKIENLQFAHGSDTKCVEP